MFNNWFCYLTQFTIRSFQPAQQLKACDTPLVPWEIDNTTGVYVSSPFQTGVCFVYLSFQLIRKNGEDKAKGLTSPAFLLPSARLSPFLAGSDFHTGTRSSLYSLSKAPYTPMSFRLKPQRFWYVLAYHPHYNARKHWLKRKLSKTVSKVELFENVSFWKCLVFGVDRWKRRLLKWPYMPPKRIYPRWISGKWCDLNVVAHDFASFVQCLQLRIALTGAHINVQAAT